MVEVEGWLLGGEVRWALTGWLGSISSTPCDWDPPSRGGLIVSRTIVIAQGKDINAEYGSKTLKMM